MRGLSRLLIICVFTSVVLSCGGGGSSSGSGDDQSQDPATFKPVLSIDSTKISLPAFNLSISVSQDTSVINENIVFSVDVTGNSNSITQIEWDFDDGATQLGSEVTKSFTEAGMYKIEVTVLDSIGEQETVSTVVSVFADVPVSVPEFAGMRFGDVDGNGAIESADVSIVNNHINNAVLITDASTLIAADIDLDNAITANDSALISQAINSIWPTYISETSGIPSTPIMFMLPALLNSQAEIEVELSTGQTLTPTRTILGYASFILPIEESSMTTGVFEEKDITINIYVNGSVDNTFNFHINKPEELSNPTGTFLKQNIEELDEALIELRTNIDALLTDANATAEERDMVLHILQVAENEILSAQSDYLAILDGIDENTLAFIEKLSVTGNAALINNTNKFSSPTTINNLSLTISGITAPKSKTWPAGCSVSDRLDRLVRTTDTRAANKDLFAPITETLSTTCNVITAGALVFPPIAVVAAGCQSASAALGTGQTLIEVITEVVPTLGSNLNVEATPDSLLPDQSASILITAEVDDSKLCSAAANQVSGHLAGLVFEKITKKLRFKSAAKILAKAPIIERALYRKSITSTINQIINGVKTGVTVLADEYITNIRSDFCHFNDGASSELTIPSCALDTFKTYGSAATGILDKDLGTYEGPSITECKEGNVTVSSTLSSGDGYYRGNGDTTIDQLCEETDQIIILTASCTFEPIVDPEGPFYPGYYRVTMSGVATSSKEVFVVASTNPSNGNFNPVDDTGFIQNTTCNNWAGNHIYLGSFGYCEKQTSNSFETSWNGMHFITNDTANDVTEIRAHLYSYNGQGSLVSHAVDQIAFSCPL